MKEHVIPSTSAASSALFHTVRDKSIPNIDGGDSDFDSDIDTVVKMLVSLLVKIMTQRNQNQDRCLCCYDWALCLSYVS